MTRPGREVLFEFIQIGDSVKVSAVDARTNVEVSLVGSARSSREVLQRAALCKLRYVIEKTSPRQTEKK